MATITVRGLDEALKRKLRIRAANNGRSMEQEVRVILFDTLEGTAKQGTGSLFDEIRADIAELGGADLELSVRELIGEPLEFD